MLILKKREMKYKLAKLYDSNNNLDNRWYVYYYYKHPESKEMKRFKINISGRIKTKFARRARAQELIKNVNLKLKRGWNPFTDDDLRVTKLFDAMDFAMKLKSSTLKKRSAWTYDSVIKHFKSYLTKKKLHNITVDDIDAQLVQKYFDEMLINEDISLRTYNNRLTPLKTIFNVLYKREYVSFNPFINIDKLKIQDPEITAYTEKELESIKNTLPEYNYELYIITQLIFYCFLRPAEIVRLQFKDLLWDHGMIVIPGTKSKNKKSQVIIIPNQFKENLKDWNMEYDLDYYIFSKNLKPGTKEVAPTRIAESWRKYANEHNIKKNIYDFKHTGNGYAFDQGFNSRDIQLQNRHSSLDETQKYLNKFRRVPSEKFKENFDGY